MIARRLPLLMFAGLVLFGCSPKVETPAPSGKEDGPPAVAVKDDNTPAPVTKDPASPSPGKAREPALPFAKAVRFISPEGENQPPDITAGGKHVGKIYEAIAGRAGKKGLWEEVSFTTPEGKKIRHTAHVKTDLGTIQIELFADEAPNHVRNFIALARAGYYEGLSFHQSIRKEATAPKAEDELPTQRLFYLEAGCPRGTGEVGYGSIGYWLKNEIVTALTHEEGTVGAWHGPDLDAAACRFYITLCPAPGLDGNFTIFGKIVHGLEVAHTINSRPAMDGARPREPVLIREVTIHSKVLD